MPSAMGTLRLECNRIGLGMVDSQDMPLVDKLERIGALLQNGTLSPQEFHQAKDHLLKTASPGGNPLGTAAPAPARPRMDAARERAKREYHMVRHHCLVRDRHFALREPRLSHLMGISLGLALWLSLGTIVVAGFYALNPTLAVLPLGTMIVGAIFMLGSICAHMLKILRLRRAKRKYHQS
jgi:hypothetical protein